MKKNKKKQALIDWKAGLQSVKQQMGDCHRLCLLFFLNPFFFDEINPLESKLFQDKTRANSARTALSSIHFGNEVEQIQT